MLQTLPVREAGHQLQYLVDQTRSTYQPVILTNDQTAEPMAILIDPEIYKRFVLNYETILTRRLNKVSELLDTLAQQSHIEMVRQAFPAAWRWYLEGVWEASEDREASFRQLTILLQMAIDGMNMANFTQNHLATLQKCLRVLRKPEVDQDDLIDCDDALIQMGLPVLLSFDEEVLALYVDET